MSSLASPVTSTFSFIICAFPHRRNQISPKLIRRSTIYLQKATVAQTVQTFRVLAFTTARRCARPKHTRLSGAPYSVRRAPCQGPLQAAQPGPARPMETPVQQRSRDQQHAEVQLDRRSVHRVGVVYGAHFIPVTNYSDFCRDSRPRPCSSYCTLLQGCALLRGVCRTP